MIVRTIVGVAFFWGTLYAGQHYLFDRVAAEIGRPSPADLMPHVAELPKFDPQAWQTIKVPQIDTQAYGRVAIESMARDMMRQNDEALARARAATIPPYIPGLHH